MMRIEGKVFNFVKEITGTIASKRPDISDK
jgi:hypothetical protein